jgi:hypothetical protein
MPHASYGRGSRDVRSTAADPWVDARDIALALRLPRGWQWDADRYGAMVRRIDDPEVNHHPTGEDLAEAFCGEPLASAWCAAAERAAAERGAMAHTARRERLLARLSSRIMVSRDDAVRAGYCRAGIERWCRAAGIPADTTEISTRQLMRLAQQTGEPRAIRVAVLAARRAFEQSRPAEAGA